jgi:hypothetical protein
LRMQWNGDCDEQPRKRDATEPVYDHAALDGRRLVRVASLLTCE